MCILRLEHVTKFYGTQCVLDDVNLEIIEPTILALVAPNGTGKSTLLNIITNIERASEGEIQVLGRKNTDVRMFESMTYLQDNSVLYPDLTGQDHLNFIQDIHQIPSHKIEEVTQRLGMTDYLNKAVKKYSLGMKQHLLSALAILPNAKLIILDEPLNGLDPSSILRVREILKELYSQGTTILFSSHNLDEIDRLTDNILFLSNGALISSQEYRSTKLEYTFVLEKIEQVFAFLKTENLLPEKIAKKKISVSLSAKEYEKFLYFCQKEMIEIHDRNINEENTKNIYFELYRGEADEII